MIERLKEHLKDVPPEQWGEHALCYDNVCNVVRQHSFKKKQVRETQLAS